MTRHPIQYEEEAYVNLRACRCVNLATQPSPLATVNTIQKCRLSFWINWFRKFVKHQNIKKKFRIEQ